ncbi:MAG: prepilin-type N-terminal cleavage/methylation domain-containing protein [Oscillospiraceae bacterium]|nr:prepilin-type N-terminal cleavage/methylation domain-containing protein [Oscillospiraceae bacterium]
MKKYKGITLVELLVAMAVFSIIMVGVMNMVQPVQERARDAKIMNYQKTNEETLVTYIGEQLRYANNVLIAEKGSKFTPTKAVNSFAGPLGASEFTIDSPKKAVEAFAGYQGIKNQLGENLKPQSKNNGQYFHVLVWDGRLNGTAENNGGYAIDNTPAIYHGRLFSSYDGETHTIDQGVYNVASNDFSDTRYLYPVFGKGYFGTSDMFLYMNLDDNGMLTLKCTSDYYFNAAKKKKNNSSNNPTLGTFQLRNYENGNVKFLVNGAHVGMKSTNSEDNIFYIVYTTDDDVNHIMNPPTPAKTWNYDTIPTGQKNPQPTFEPSSGGGPLVPNEDCLAVTEDNDGKSNAGSGKPGSASGKGNNGKGKGSQTTGNSDSNANINGPKGQEKKNKGN